MSKTYSSPYDGTFPVKENNLVLPFAHLSIVYRKAIINMIERHHFLDPVLQILN